MNDKKQIYFLEGGLELDDPYDFRALNDNYDCHQITNLYREPEKLAELAEAKPWGIYILTTGIFSENKQELIDTFLNTGYIPQAIIFGSERSALEYLDIARKLKQEHGTGCYEYDLFDEKLIEIDWI